MDPISLVAMIAILGAIACFLVETFRAPGFNLLAFGLALMSTFFLLAIAIPAFST